MGLKILAADKVFPHVFFLSSDIRSVCKRERNSGCIDIYLRKHLRVKQTIHSLQQKYASDAECKRLNHKCFFAEEALSLSLIQLSWHLFSLHFFYLFRVFIHQIDDVSLIKSDLKELFRSWAPHKRPAFSLWSICADG